MANKGYTTCIKTRTVLLNLVLKNANRYRLFLNLDSVFSDSFCKVNY